MVCTITHALHFLDNIIVVQFNDDTPFVDLNTVRLSFFSSVPPTNATCFVQRSIEGELDCKSLRKYGKIIMSSLYLAITVILFQSVRDNYCVT